MPLSIIQKLPLLRSALERWARGRRAVRKLPNGTSIYVSPDAQLKYLYSRFDPDLIEIAERHVRASSVVWDIGANCGIFAFSARAAREVIAVEADPFLANLLQESTVLNGSSVSVLCAAISAERGLASFSIAARGRASNHLSSVDGRSQTGGERARLLVSTLTLDQLLESGLPPTIVKIDVEGAEVDVLRGAAKMLRDVRPVIYLETGEDTHEACAEILKKANYNLSKGADLNWLCLPQ